ncbi:MAG: glycosyltransferase family 4 protein [Planctomycetales bacterium]|nr:glycosyltransferase family 4 protein [Planctomycetales bacterium]
MRLAYLINQYPAISHTFVRREIRALEALGHEVVRFSIRPSRDAIIDPEDQKEAAQTTVVLQTTRCITALAQRAMRHPLRTAAAAITLARLGRRAGGGVVRHLAYLAEAAHLVEAMQAQQVTHLHAHFGTNSATVALLAEKLGGPSFSFTVHGPEEFDRPERESLAEKIGAARFVAAISSFGKSQLQRWCAYSEWSKIRVVHCGLDASFLEQPTSPVPDVPQLVCVGRLAEQKGHFVLLQAARSLAERGVQFQIVCVGDGDFRSRLESYIRKHDLAEYIRLVGWQKEAEVQQWLKQSRAMVLPSFAEGLPVVIMEALAMGRPVISTYVAGIPELIVPGENGWLVPAGDPDALANAVAACLATAPDTLTQMGQAGQRRVRERHNITTEAGKLAEALVARS